MNFKKLLIVIALVVVVITTYKFFTRIDRGNASAVATAFTKAMKSQDLDKAADFYIPDQADAWRTKMDEHVRGLKTNRREMFYERFPDSPQFGGVSTVAGKSTIASSDQQFKLEMTQVGGDWYIAHFE